MGLETGSVEAKSDDKTVWREGKPEGLTPETFMDWSQKRGPQKSSSASLARLLALARLGDPRELPRSG